MSKMSLMKPLFWLTEMNSSSTASIQWKDKRLLVKDRIASDDVSFEVINNSSTIKIDSEGIKINSSDPIHNFDKEVLTGTEVEGKKAIPSSYAVKSSIDSIRALIGDQEKFSALLLPYILTPTIDPISHFPAFKICLEDDVFGKINRVFVSNPFGAEDTWEIEPSDLAKALRSNIPSFTTSSDGNTAMSIIIVTDAGHTPNRIYFHDSGINRWVRPNGNDYMIGNYDEANSQWKDDEIPLSASDFPDYIPLPAKYDSTVAGALTPPGASGDYCFNYSYSTPRTIDRTGNYNYTCRSTMLGVIAPASPTAINCANLTFKGDMSGAFSTIIDNTDISSVGDLEPIYLETVKDITIDSTTNNVTAVNGLFMGQRAIKAITSSSSDLSNIEDAAQMFKGCENLTVTEAITFLNVNSSVHMDNCVSAANMFEGVGKQQTAVTPVGLVNMFSSNNVLKYASEMFKNANISGALNIFTSFTPAGDQHFNDRSCMNEYGLVGMFEGCSGITSIAGIQDWDTSAVKNFDRIFSGCSALSTLYLTNWSFEHAEQGNDMFNGNDSLITVQIKKKFIYSQDGTDPSGNEFKIANKGSVIATSGRKIYSVSSWDSATDDTVITLGLTNL